MKNDLRKNPRFVASEGIPARILAHAKSLNGTILNFSSTGFAVVVSEEFGHTDGATLDVEFSAQNQRTQLKLTAQVVNKEALSDKRMRLGCTITDMNNLSKEYFTFLTGILGKQGFLKSMATKPVKCAGQQGTPPTSGG